MHGSAIVVFSVSATTAIIVFRGKLLKLTTVFMQSHALFYPHKPAARVTFLASGLKTSPNFLAFNPNILIDDSYWLHLARDKSFVRSAAGYHVAVSLQPRIATSPQAKLIETFIS